MENFSGKGWLQVFLLIVGRVDIAERIFHNSQRSLAKKTAWKDLKIKTIFLKIK